MIKKPKNENHSILLGTVIIIVAMIIVFGGVFAWMYSRDMLFLPEFVEQILGLGKDDNELPWDLGALSEVLRNGKDEQGNTVAFDVTYENLREALLSEEPEKGVFLTAVMQFFDGDTPVWQNVTYSRDGERFRVQLYEIMPQENTESPEIKSLTIADEKTVYILDYPSGKSTVIPRNNSIVPENEAGIPSVDYLLSVVSEFPQNVTDEPAEKPAEMGASGITDTAIKLLQTEDGKVYYVSYTDTEHDITEEYYISLEYRMIISATTKQGGKTVYSYKTKSFSADPAIYTQASLYSFSESADQ